MTLPGHAPLFSFGLLSDVQYADKEDTAVEGRRQRYREAPAKLRAAVDDYSARQPTLEFVLHCGDIVDGSPTTEADLRRVLELFGRLPAGVPVYHVLGNHCMAAGRGRLMQALGLSQPDSPSSEEDSAKDDGTVSPAVAENHPSSHKDGASSHGDGIPSQPSTSALLRMGRGGGGGFYSADVAPGWRLLALDTTEMSGHSGLPPDSPLSREAAAFVQEHPLGEGEPQMSPWNGGVGSRQLEWLKQELRRAEADGRKVVVAVHHQIGEGAARATHMAWNWREVQVCLLACPAVKLVAAGHDHEGGYAARGKVHFLTLQALVEAPPGGNAYSVVHVYEDRLQLEGHGTVPSRTLAL